MKKLFIAMFLSSFIFVFGLIMVKAVLSPNKDGKNQDAVLEKQIYETFDKLDKEYVEKEYSLSGSPSDETIDKAEAKALTETAIQYNVSLDTVKGIIVRQTEQKYK